MSANMQRKMFTTHEYHRMTEAGILREDDHLELIRGDIIQMAAAIGSYHAACVDKLNRLFNRILPESVIVRIQSPVRIKDHSEPEPDIVILKFHEEFYAENHPKPEDVLLIVEVSDSTLGYDRETKIPLYGKAGICEAWIVNLGEKCVEVYRTPSEHGYEELRKFRGEMSMTPERFPDVRISVDDIIGKWKYPLAV